jgi:hypothetical protein
LRYHFHIRDADGLIADDEGSELPDLAAAREEAQASARDLVIEELKQGALVQERQIEITAPDGTVLERITVQDIGQ